MLTEQIEEAGRIKRKVIWQPCNGYCLAVCLAMLRIMMPRQVGHFLLPGLLWR